MGDETLPSFYHISQDVLRILDADEFDEEALGRAVEKLEIKAGNIAGYSKFLGDQAKALKEHEDRIKNYRETLENKRTRLLAYLRENMEAVGVYKIAWKEHRITLAKNPPSCLLTDESKIPSEYMIPQPAKVDKRSILEELKQNKQVPGAQLSPPTFGVRIR